MSTVSHTQILTNVSQEVQQRFANFDDPSHGWQHVQRVYRLAQYIADKEGADALITGLAALLHDLGRLVHCESVSHATLSVEEARSILARYPLEQSQIEAVLHAIEAHSFSQGIEPRTLEARVLRDADRLDALGAIGILRWAITGTIRRETQTLSYHPEDPFGEWHRLDDSRYMLDHFYIKLLKLEQGIYTATGQSLARQRSAYMHAYLQELKTELELELP
ncbi:MAG TPA: HD domain-containing protein [Ktedonobacteraceae bacterium]|nr:HD domain-containing protein [Ktedonobacteraceae bacterium]